MRCEITRVWEEITKDYCKSNGKLKIEFVEKKTFIELNTIEDIIELAKKVDCEIIIDKDGEVEIYDNYRE